MRLNQVLAAGLLIMSCLLVACSAAAGSTTTKVPPATVEKTDAGTLVTLTVKAAERIGIATAEVTAAESVREGSAGDRVVPYGAIIYDVNGNAFVYTNTVGLTYVRAPITIDYIEGDVVVLSDGPPLGTTVATIGVAELYGAETGIK